MKKLFLSVCLFFGLAANSAHATEPWQGIRNNEGMLLYSDMGFIKEEGEYSGHEIAIMPYNPWYSDIKYKVLWRSGSGYLNMPLILDASVQGNVLKITVPEDYDEAGNWALTVNKSNLIAEGPLGHHYTLKKMVFR